MRHTIHILYLYVLAALLTGCTGKDKGNTITGKDGSGAYVSQHSDTVHTLKAVMDMYAYQPVRALRMMDTVVMVGNATQVLADVNRAVIYSSTLEREQLDSMLGGKEGAGLVKAKSLGERLLNNDTVKADLPLRHRVLETLAYTCRMQNDTLGWLNRLTQLVEVCREQGPEAETDALRAEAEMGAALHALGRHDEGAAKLDSVIYVLDASLDREENRGRFSELDALIIALKRKIVMLGAHDKYAETLPLSHKIIEQLDEYEAHPDAYHDGSQREPANAAKRVDYIRFYRNQAQNYITSAYAALGENHNMLDAFTQIDKSIREAASREHIALYNSLQHKMNAERQREKAHRTTRIAFSIGFLAILALIFAIVISVKNNIISRKNRVLVKLVEEGIRYKELYNKANVDLIKKDESGEGCPKDLNSLPDDQLFIYINDIILREKLFLDSKFERQSIINRFQLSKERVGAVFSKGSEFSKLSAYILQLRLDYAAKMLVEHADRSIGEVATECGFSSNSYFSDRFRQHFSMSPIEFRKAKGL